jgi:hypothetical protein
VFIGIRRRGHLRTTKSHPVAISGSYQGLIRCQFQNETLGVARDVAAKLATNFFYSSHFASKCYVEIFEFVASFHIWP